MPFNFTGNENQSVAKLKVVSDGEFCTTDGYGAVVVSALSSYTAFKTNPVRSGTGVWSVALKDGINKIIDIEVKTVLAPTHYLSTQLLTPTVSNGITTLNWVFNTAGTPADLPAGGQFTVYIVYSESSVT